MIEKRETKPEEPKVNPTVTAPKRVTDATRIPMATRESRLAVPEIPGYHLHWAHSGRTGRMLAAGYEFVNQDEVDVNNFDLAGDPAASGNTDLGSRVSVSAGMDVDSGRLYLMKLRSEWWDEDCKKMEAANEKIAEGIRGGAIGGGGPGDHSRKYLKEGQELFIPASERKFKKR